MSDSQAELAADMADAEKLTLEDDSIKANFARLFASGRNLAEAELSFAKVKATLVAHTLRRWLILGALAMVFLMMGVTILIVSAVIALAPYVGWLAASLIVAGCSIGLSILMALAARRTFTGLFDDDRDAA